LLFLNDATPPNDLDLFGESGISGITVFVFMIGSYNFFSSI
jgi:hypothetical protein